MTLEDRLSEHMEEHQAESVAHVLRLGSDYGGGDALAGAKLGTMNRSQWERVTELLSEAGYDGKLNSVMSVVSFTNDPSTDDEKLNAEIKDL